MHCCYHPGYALRLPAGHPFPISKYPLLRNALLEQGTLVERDLVEPEPIGRSAMAAVHTVEYLDKLERGALSAAELRRLGLPWSPQLWHRSRLAAGGTLLAARIALRTGLAGNLAGGTHHAFADHGEGFCVLNDVAIAATCLRAERVLRRIAVIDLDVHQGNGTASLFERTPEVFTFSMHGEHNYPLRKMKSTLDVPLPDGTEDAEYLGRLEHHLNEVLERAAAELVFYVAGVDVAAGDRYGKLALSEAGIRLRDRHVIEAVRGRGVPLVIVLGGGYAPTPERTAALHGHAFREALALERRSSVRASASARAR